MMLRAADQQNQSNISSSELKRVRVVRRSLNDTVDVFFISNGYVFLRCTSLENWIIVALFLKRSPQMKSIVLLRLGFVGCWVWAGSFS